MSRSSITEPMLAEKFGSIEAALDWVDAERDKPRSLKAIAGSLGIAQSVLSKILKKYERTDGRRGRTPIDPILLDRFGTIEEAFTWIDSERDKGATLEQISNALSCSRSTLTRLAKRYGQKPWNQKGSVRDILCERFGSLPDAIIAIDGLIDRLGTMRDVSEHLEVSYHAFTQEMRLLRRMQEDKNSIGGEDISIPSPNDSITEGESKTGYFYVPYTSRGWLDPDYPVFPLSTNRRGEWAAVGPFGNNRCVGLGPCPEYPRTVRILERIV